MNSPGSAAPVAGHVPEAAPGFGKGVAACQADVMQHVIVKRGKAGTLAAQGKGLSKQGNERKPGAAGGADSGE